MNKEYTYDGIYNTDTYTDVHSSNNSNSIFDNIIDDDDVYNINSSCRSSSSNNNGGNSNNNTTSSSSATSSFSTSLTDLFHRYTHWKMMLIGEAGMTHIYAYIVRRCICILITCIMYCWI